MIGVDVEHTRAQTCKHCGKSIDHYAGRWRHTYGEDRTHLTECDKELVGRYGIAAEPDVPDLAALVSAVERVQALHTPDEWGYCVECHDQHPCPTRQALEIK
ncbi:hypothetical protein ACWGK5_25675 [Rhodococcus qingshengii]